MKIFSTEDVKSLLESNGYTIKEDFIYIKGELIDIEDKDGYKYKSYLSNIKNSISRGGKLLPFYIGNPYSIYNISKWISNNNKKFEIVSTKYIAAEEDLDFKCNICNSYFKRNWYDISKENLWCPFCGESKHPAHNFTEDDKIEILRKYNSGITMLSLSREYHCRNTAIKEILENNDVKIKKTYEYYTSKELARTRKYYCNEDIFEKIDSHDKAYWLGFLFADGNVYVPKGKETETKGIRIELSLKEEDYYHLRNFSNFLQSNYPVKPKIVKLNNKKILVYRIAVSSVKMGKDLISHGCVPNKSLILEYPKDLSEEYFPSFLCGYFDGDGCLSFIKHDDGSAKGAVSIMGTHSFLQTIKEKLCDRGIKSSDIYKDNRGSKVYILGISVYSHVNFFNLIYHKASYLLGRKYDKFMDMFEYKGKDYDISKVAKLFRLIY